MSTNNHESPIVDLARLLKPEEVAELLNISRSFTYQLMHNGAIPVVRLGKACRVRPQDLEAFIKQNLHNVWSSAK